MTTILLVDDAPDLRELLTTFLQEEGFTVTATDGAEKALALLAVDLPDLLILDGRLPGMSGWQCLDLLRAADRTVKLPVLMLTAAVDEIVKGQPEEPDDCTAYLAKPFDLDNLLAVMSGVIQTCNQEPVAV